MNPKNQQAEKECNHQWAGQRCLKCNAWDSGQPSEEKDEALYKAIEHILSPEGQKKLLKLVKEFKSR